jgi:hypothetical protein
MKTPLSLENQISLTDIEGFSTLVLFLLLSEWAMMYRDNKIIRIIQDVMRCDGIR